MDLISFYKFIGKLIDEGHGSKEVFIPNNFNSHGEAQIIDKNETVINENKNFVLFLH